MSLLDYYEAASLCFRETQRFPSALEEGVVHLIDTWCLLAMNYKRDRTIRRKVVEAALRLLNLADIAQLELYKGLQRLSEALRAFEFDTVDYITGRELRRDAAIQRKLKSLGYRLIPLLRTSRNLALLETLNILLPYLWGAMGPRNRKVPGTEYSEGTIRIAQLTSFAMHINNICARSYRAFAITVDGVSLEKDYTSTRYYRGKRINGIPCRRICLAFEGSKGFVPVDKIILDVPFESGKRIREQLKVPCGIHRAIKVSENVSRLVVWAPKDFCPRMPKRWKEYVNSLEQIEQPVVT